MAKTKKGAPIKKTPETNTNTNIPKNESSNKIETTTDEEKDKKKVKLSIESRYRTISLKFYDEQIPDGFDALKKAVEAMPANEPTFLIKHDKDEVTDGVWKVAKEKPHYHVISKYDTEKKGTKRVSTLLNALGIKYRKDKDDSLLKNRAMESCGDFITSIIYLTHETPKAIKDNKYMYSEDELITNVSKEEYNKLRATYVSTDRRGGVDVSQMEEIDREAYKKGYNLEDFDDWWHSLPYRIRVDKGRTVIKDSYQKGQMDRVNKNENNQIQRMCVFIYGPNNVGKTYAVRRAIGDVSLIEVSHGQSGKYDMLKASTKAMIIDDDDAPRDLIKLSDNYLTQVYRRNRNNPFWCGDIFICISNVNFDDWLKDGLGIKPGTEKYYAIKSRFFICNISELLGDIVVTIEHKSNRGTLEEQKSKNKKFETFISEVEKSVKEYHKLKSEVANPTQSVGNPVSEVDNENSGNSEAAECIITSDLQDNQKS